MSDYTLQATWSTKDALATGQALKAISATELGTEFSAIETAIATKYDTGDIASQAQAEAEASNAVIMTPLRVANWADYNAGMVGDIQALADPNADVVLGWDDSAGAAIGYTLHASILHSGTELSVDHDAATNFVADEHIAHSGVTLTAGAGLTGGGTIDASRSFAVGAGNGITVNADDVALTDAAATTSNPIDISTGAISVDLTALTTMEGNALAAGDLFYVDDGGVSKAIKVEEAGMRVQTGQTTQTVATSDMNSIMEFTGTATLTLPLNSTTALPVGVPIVLNMKHATQELTVTAATSVTLVSTFNPGGGSAASDTVKAGGTALLYKTADDVWCLSGDISD